MNNKWGIIGCAELANYFRTIDNIPWDGSLNNIYYYIRDDDNWDGNFLSNKPADMELITVADYLFKLPEKWCVRVEANSQPSIVAKWRPTKGCVDYWKTKGYINYDGYHSVEFRQGYTEITTEQFIKHVLKQTNMNTQTLTRAQLLEMHTKDTCADWRNEIESILLSAPLAFDTTPITIPQKSIDLLIKKGNITQKSLVMSAGIKLEEDKSVEVPIVTAVNSKNGITILCTRQGGEYKSKAFFLNNTLYNWELKTDNEGSLCLIPTKK